jgi:hypothetical protein
VKREKFPFTKISQLINKEGIIALKQWFSKYDLWTLWEDMSSK